MELLRKADVFELLSILSERLAKQFNVGPSATIEADHENLRPLQYGTA